LKPRGGFSGRRAEGDAELRTLGKEAGEDAEDGGGLAGAGSAGDDEETAECGGLDSLLLAVFEGGRRIARTALEDGVRELLFVGPVAAEIEARAVEDERLGARGVGTSDGFALEQDLRGGRIGEGGKMQAGVACAHVGAESGGGVADGGGGVSGGEPRDEIGEPEVEFLELLGLRISGIHEV
jgi:hypothetical protein